MCKKSGQNKLGRNKTIIVAMFSGVIIACVLYWCVIHYLIKDPIHQGTFGDMFGAVNALFSGLAFAGLIATLLYQKEELKLQQEELQQTREELKGQREEFEEQNKTLKRQRFENTFFNMLSLQQEITNNLFFQYEKEIDCNTTQSYICRGREVFEEIYTHATVESKGYIFPKNSGIKSILRGGGYNAYTEISETNRFDHYFRHLYRIFKYVDTTDLINDNERYEYACIVRSQLSDYELIMLFFNGLSDNGKEKFKPLIEKYAILKNMRPDLLPSRGDEMTFYQNGAYKYSK
jgi:hypothetical protein